MRRVQKEIKGYCKDCIYHYDDHEKGYNGEFFLTHCRFLKHSVFLNKDTCKNFKKSK